jgi:hypothetical protein
MTMYKRSLFMPILLGIGMAIGLLGIVVELRAQQVPVIKEGDLFPGVALPTPADPKDRAYLGISGKDQFAIKEMKAKVILVEIMNVYCASCQNQAPIYNKLFDLIQSQSEIRDKIKIVAIAAGNNDQEIKIFRDHFKVPFPIIPDSQYVMHKAIGGSPTPFSIFVRRESQKKPVLVAGTHLGFDEHYEELLTQLRTLIKTDLAAIREKGEKTKGQILAPKLPFSEEEILAKVKAAFPEGEGQSNKVEKISLSPGRDIYMITVEKNGQAARLFARVISQLPTCDVCHDSHFIITFDASGKILQFIPLQLTKYGNEDWSEADIAKIRGKIVGRYVYHPFFFKPKVDAVTSATITSAAIFRGLNEGQVLYKELKKKGLI